MDKNNQTNIHLKSNDSQRINPLEISSDFDPSEYTKNIYSFIESIKYMFLDASLTEDEIYSIHTISNEFTKNMVKETPLTLDIFLEKLVELRENENKDVDELINLFKALID